MVNNGDDGDTYIILTLKDGKRIHLMPYAGMFVTIKDYSKMTFFSDLQLAYLNYGGDAMETVKKKGNEVVMDIADALPDLDDL